MKPPFYTPHIFGYIITRNLIYIFVPFTSIDAQLTLTTAVTAATFSVTWGNYNAYLYNLTISEDSIPANSFLSLPPTATGHTFTNLKPYTYYTVKVTPIALDGQNGPMKEIRKQTSTAGALYQSVLCLSIMYQAWVRL